MWLVEENMFIFDMILNKFNVLKVGVWFGFYREDDDFYWVDGVLLVG